MYVRDEQGQVVSQLINESDCWGFGISNMIIAFIFFLILSLIFNGGVRQLNILLFNTLKLTLK